MRVEPSTGRFVPRAEFDRLAPRYERGSRAMSLGQIVRWRRRAIAALQPREGAVYLDVGAGTGELTRALIRAVPGVRVIALDASAKMLEAGGLDALAGVEAVLGDAAATGLAAHSVDGAVSGFMLRHLDRPDRFLREMHRVVGPGGRLVLLEAALPPPGLGRLAFRVYFFGLAWLIGAIVTGSWAAHVGLRKSLRAFPGPQALVEAAAREHWSVESLRQGRWSGFFVLALRAKKPS